MALGEFELGGHQTEVERAIESDRERLERPAALEVGESIRNRCNRTVDDRGRAAPVENERRACRISSASVIVGITRTHGVCRQSDMEPSIRDHPDTMPPKRVVAGQLPSDASGLHGLLRSARECVPALSHPEERAATTKL